MCNVITDNNCYAFNRLFDKVQSVRDRTPVRRCFIQLYPQKFRRNIVKIETGMFSRCLLHSPMKHFVA